MVSRGIPIKPIWEMVRAGFSCFSRLWPLPHFSIEKTDPGRRQLVCFDKYVRQTTRVQLRPTSRNNIRGRHDDCLFLSPQQLFARSKTLGCYSSRLRLLRRVSATLAVLLCRTCSCGDGYVHPLDREVLSGPQGCVMRKLSSRRHPTTHNTLAVGETISAAGFTDSRHLAMMAISLLCYTVHMQPGGKA